jgi:non-lysosomal glucosylceramidase
MIARRVLKVTASVCSYSEASLPVGLLEVELVDLWPHQPLLDASVMLFSANDDGCDGDGNEARARRGAACADVTHSSFRVDIEGGSGSSCAAGAAVGVVMTRPYNVYRLPADATTATAAPGSSHPYSGSISIAALERKGLVNASTCTMIDASLSGTDFGRNGASSASRIWDLFSSTGELRETHGLNAASLTRISARADADVVAAVCLKQCARSHTALNFQFSICWDFPLVRFGSGRVLPRYYSRFFGASGLASPWMAAVALGRSGNWLQRIMQWQMGGAFGDESLPDFYRYTLYNELYFLVDGGSIWLNTRHANPNETTCILSDVLKMKESVDARCARPDSTGQPMHHLEAYIHIDAIISKLLEHDDECSRCGGNAASIGQFLYLEGHEYLMYNTYDVHFYASFALLMLWPQLELSIQRDFAACVPIEDLTERMMLAHGDRKPRKVAGCVPHDLGSPSEDPFVKTNVYNFQDVSKWKDLGPKFVLQIFRDYRYALSIDFLRDLYPTVLSVMNNTGKFDSDGDGMIENEGFPDQTYDIWIARGVSAYCGGLWVAACFATSEIANILGDNLTRVRYTEIGDSARTVYIRQLWNGSYFNYDNSQSSHSDSIMADMLAGNWFCRLCGLPPVVTSAQAVSSLKTIYNMNVIAFSKLNKRSSLIGAVNGMRPDGTVDDSCLQSREVWSGVTYALAAMMLEESQVLVKYIEENNQSYDNDNVMSNMYNEEKSFVFEDKYCLRSVPFCDLEVRDNRHSKFAKRCGKFFKTCFAGTFC